MLLGCIVVYMFMRSDNDNTESDALCVSKLHNLNKFRELLNFIWTFHFGFYLSRSPIRHITKKLIECG